MKIRQPSQPDQSCSGKSGSLLSLINPAQANLAPLPSLINPPQANLAFRQTKEISEKSTLNRCFYLDQQVEAQMPPGGVEEGVGEESPHLPLPGGYIMILVHYKVCC